MNPILAAQQNDMRDINDMPNAPDPADGTDMVDATDTQIPAPKIQLPLLQKTEPCRFRWSPPLLPFPSPALQ